MRFRFSSYVGLIVLCSTSSALADEGEVIDTKMRNVASVYSPASGPAGDETAGQAAAVVLVRDTTAPSEAPSKPGPPAREPYANPFQLRGVNPNNAVRLDTTVAPFTDPKTGNGQVETISFLQASARVSPSFGVNTRVGLVRNDRSTEEGGRVSTTALTNVGVSGMYAKAIGRYFRFASSMGVTLPVGQGGGNNPDADVQSAMKAAAFARGSMDNGMFNANDLGFPMGVDLAYTRGRLTAQLELSVAPNVRVRGEQKQSDKTKVNSTSGVFVGYFVIPRRLSLGAEAHYQRFLSTPESVTKDSSLRDNLTAGGGIRTYFELAKDVNFRPGVSYCGGLVGASGDRGYHMLQVDMGVQF